jgi:hypothetical protein
MSSLYYKHQLQLTYNAWRVSLDKTGKLLDKLDAESKQIEDTKAKQVFNARLNVLYENYNMQIDLVNNLYEFMASSMVDKDTLTYTKEKLAIARKFINALGGDANSINWLKHSDF